MPADNTINQSPSARHGDGDAPYQCKDAMQAPGATWAIDYGYCRHSLDQLAGINDKRCPSDCQHKAPEAVAVRFLEIYHADGNQKAAAYSRRAREDADKNNIQAQS